MRIGEKVLLTGRHWETWPVVRMILPTYNLTHLQRSSVQKVLPASAKLNITTWLPAKNITESLVKGEPISQGFQRYFHMFMKYTVIYSFKIIRKTCETLTIHIVSTCCCCIFHSVSSSGGRWMLKYEMQRGTVTLIPKSKKSWDKQFKKICS